MTKPFLKNTIRAAELASQPDEIDAINTRCRELAARDKQLVAEQLDLEQTSRGQAVSDGSAALEAAARMLAGEVGPPAPKSGRERLEEIIAERRTIAVALGLAERKLFQLTIDRAVERQRAAADQWAELQRERALCAVRLQKLNRQALQMLAPLRGPVGGETNMPAAFGGRNAQLFLGGDGSAHAGDFYEFLKCVVDTGIVTRGELDKA